MDAFEIAVVAEQSADFRRVLWTGEHTQLVVMTIPPDGEIGVETHDENDQILSFVSGIGKAVIEGESGRSSPATSSSCPPARSTTSSTTARTRSSSTRSTARRTTPTAPCTTPGRRPTPPRSPARTSPDRLIPAGPRRRTVSGRR